MIEGFFAQAGVVRALGFRREAARGHGLNIYIDACLLKYLCGKAVPGAYAFIGGMVNAVRISLHHITEQLGQICRVRRRADLVIYDSQFCLSIGVHLFIIIPILAADDFFPPALMR